MLTSQYGSLNPNNNNNNNNNNKETDRAVSMEGTQTQVSHVAHNLLLNERRLDKRVVTKELATTRKNE